jgi:hypothetical protein
VCRTPCCGATPPFGVHRIGREMHPSPDRFRFAHLADRVARTIEQRRAQNRNRERAPAARRPPLRRRPKNAAGERWSRRLPRYVAPGSPGAIPRDLAVLPIHGFRSSDSGWISRRSPPRTSGRSWSSFRFPSGPLASQVDPWPSHHLPTCTREPLLGSLSGVVFENLRGDFSRKTIDFADSGPRQRVACCVGPRQESRFSHWRIRRLRSRLIAAAISNRRGRA